MITTRVRYIKNSGTQIQFFASGNVFHDMSLSAITSFPAWITPSYLGFPTINYLDVDTDVAALGTYSYYFTENGGLPPSQDALLIIEIVDSLIESLDTCTGTGDATLVWINRQGGRSSYTFNQRKDYEFRIGSPNTFDNGGIIKYNNRGKNFYAWTVYKTGITDNEMTLITSLRTSIQAWFYAESNGVSTPIIIDNNSFKTGSTKEKLKEVSFSFRFADYQEIQSQ